ncbi:hypothetical protein ASPCADRAFT_5464 [Aspergillus carbonarius ITEM 5010]|uniref:Peptidase S33 tripeptidyl aminopeptidase-like C-terminal domain-containing protein n=1 Tax=Aspergillus carbonarius (strain ITEM 5010) TaxID=602072 RepID=A0A1R3RNT3_ASPC5|nr:hypothetical protein ASPCADRAFT_5464 [Aspergillus carbonarius ITEM 5010]
MDWNKISDSRSVAIAIFKLPAAVSTTDSRFRGTLISNLGGPGQSGVQMVLGAGSFIRELVDDEDHKYGLVSFDPRGVWQSTPSLDCFEGDDYARGLWEWEKRIMGNLDGSNQAAIQAHIAAAKAFGGFCENKKHGFAEHVSTAAIARDMLEIVDKIESERKEQSSHLDQELLSTGPAAPITELIQALFNIIKESPVPVIQERNSTLFNLTDLQQLYLTPCYSPIAFFPQVAEDHDQLLKGQYTDIVNNNPELAGPAAHQKTSCDEAIGGSDPAKYWAYAALETGFSVICGDRVDVRNTTTGELASYVQHMIDESPSIGSLWATSMRSVPAGPIEPNGHSTVPSRLLHQAQKLDPRHLCFFFRASLIQ